MRDRDFHPVIANPVVANLDVANLVVANLVVAMERLTRRTDFLAAAGGARAPVGGFVLQARARGDARSARVGFTVSRQVGNAVDDRHRDGSSRSGAPYGPARRRT